MKRIQNNAVSLADSRRNKVPAITKKITHTKLYESRGPEPNNYLFNNPLLLTKAIRLLSGLHDGVLMVPWPPYK